MQQWSELAITALGMGKNVDWVESPSEGLSGGLLTLWKKDEIQIIERKRGKNYIELKGTCVALNLNFICFNIYAPQKLSQKKQLRRDLSDRLCLLKDTHAILIEDFNSILFQTDKENCEFCIVKESLFSYLI